MLEATRCACRCPPNTGPGNGRGHPPCVTATGRDPHTMAACFQGHEDRGPYAQDEGKRQKGEEMLENTIWLLDIGRRGPRGVRDTQ